MFIAENSSSEILKDIVTQRKDYGYRVYEFPNEEINISELQNFERKRNSYRFYSYSKSFKQKLLEEINREAENDKIKFH